MRENSRDSRPGRCPALRLSLCLALHLLHLLLPSTSGGDATSLAPPSTNGTSEVVRKPGATTQATPTPATPSPHNPFLRSPCGGATYIRWGRKSCSGDAELVYTGNAVGGYSGNTGAPADLLCMPLVPMYANFSPSHNSSTYIYGTEYWTYNRLPNFHNHRENVPCALCRSPTRSSAVMIPARTACYPGWQVEYFGYLMSGAYNQAATSNYYCVDHQPQNVYGGRGDDSGYRLFFVESTCDESLLCPPFQNYYELTCVVCSK